MGKLLGLFLLLSQLWLHAGAIRWRGDYNAAHREALEKGHPLLVLLIREKCTACRDLVLRLAVDTEISSWINRSTVPVIVRADERSDYPVELYYTTRFPTLFWTDSRRELPLRPPCFGADSCFDALKRWQRENP